MPYRWTDTPDGAQRLDLWPHQALRPAGFVWFFGLTAGLMAVPLLATLGTPILWALLPFLGGAIGAVWWAIRRNQRDRSLTETLVIAGTSCRLTRQDADGRLRDWQANPYWVAPRLHRRGGPVPDYLTLTGGSREVELGAFLTEAERRALCAELTERLARAR